MKNFGFCLVCLFSITQVAAQDTLHVYFDSLWHKTTAENAFYHQMKVKAGSAWKEWDYYPSGKLKMKGAYSDDSCRVREGNFVWYDANGSLSSSYTYDHGKANGPSEVYYKSGKKHITGNYKMDKYDGEWTAYYESGKILGKATFTDGQQVSASFYNEDGSADNNTTAFFRKAEFPGGQQALDTFLHNELKYPKEALDNEIHGVVMVQFLVSKDGTLNNIKIIRPVHPLLDKEALRVVEKMPRWQPCINAGRISDMICILPVSFRLNE